VRFDFFAQPDATAIDRDVPISSIDLTEFIILFASKHFGLFAA
jgi:hypothetical protein